MEARTDSLTLARHYVEIGQPERALDALGRLGPDTDDVERWRLRGWALVELEDYDGAVRAAQEGLELAPESPWLLRLVAVAEGHRGRLGEAERAVLAALHQEPDDPFLLCTYAQLTARGGQLDKAERLAERAAALEPEDETVIQTRMGIAYLGGDDRLAERLGQDLLARDPDNASGHRMVGASLLDRGDVGGASRHFDTAAGADVRDDEAATVAREVRAESHPLLWPLWPFRRLGAIGAWVAAMVTIAALAAAGLETLLGVFVIAYIALCVYSWVAPPLLRAWLRRRGP